jgi:hypothetical protein
MSTTCEPLIEDVAADENLPAVGTGVTSWVDPEPYRISGRLAAYRARRAHRRRARRERAPVIDREQRSDDYLDNPSPADWHRAMRFTVQR